DLLALLGQGLKEPGAQEVRLADHVLPDTYDSDVGLDGVALLRDLVQVDEPARDLHDVLVHELVDDGDSRHLFNKLCRIRNRNIRFQIDGTVYCLYNLWPDLWPDFRFNRFRQTFFVRALVAKFIVLAVLGANAPFTRVQ